VELRWTGKAYEVAGEAADAGGLRQALRREGRWSLFKDPSGALQLVDARGGIVARCDGAIVDGALRQDRLLEIGMDTAGTWVRTAATFERGAGGRPTEWTVDPVKSIDAGEEARQVPAWAGRFLSGDKRSWGPEGPMIRRSEGQILAGRDSLLTVEGGDQVYRLESGLWVVRAAGELRWVKPGRKWH
jgi:hypothetical protein